MNKKFALIALLGCASSTALLAQSATPARSTPSELVDEEDIIVTGQRLRGAVLGDIPPEATFNAADIRSFGVSTMSELLEQLAPQTESGRGGSPVVLLNGRRISGFAELRDIPTEAIQRVEVLPEEVALKYGYRAEQKVVNIVLRQRFRALTTETSGTVPTDGGQAAGQGEGTLLHLNREGRFNLAVKYQESSSLLESERGLQSSAAATGIANTGNLASLRTLLPDTRTLTTNAVWNRTLFGDVSTTLNATGTYTDSNALNGPAREQLLVPANSPFSLTGASINRYASELGALEQDTRSLTGHLGLSMNGNVSNEWRWTLTGNYDITGSRTLTERGIDVTGLQAQLNALDPGFNPFLPLSDSTPLTLDSAHSTIGTGNLQAIVNGSLFTLPAGDVTTSFKLGGEINHLDATSRRSGLITDSNLSRETGSGQLSFDLPIASRRKGVLSPLGELSANLNLAYDEVSDFGTLRTLGYGVNWTPVKPLSLIVSMTEQDGAPSVQQLGNPVVVTAGSRVFDFVRGTTVDIARITGGNPSLMAEDRRVLKIGGTLKPAAVSGLSLTANYLRTRVKNPIASFPTATAQIEAAFPARFTRDANGNLLRIDSTPVNFARENSDQIRWGFNFSKQIGKTPPRQPGENNPLSGLRPPEGGPPPGEGGPPPPGGNAGGGGNQPGSGGFGGAGGPGGGGPRFGGGPGGRAARLQLSVYHTWLLRDEILIRPGVPVLDLLNGAAIGSSGGQPQHKVEMQLGLTKNGYGLRLSGNWQSATTVNGGFGGGTSATDLRFSDLTTFDLRLFANTGQNRSLVQAHPFFRGTRVTLAVTNLFNERIDVRDASGVTPINYQPAYLNALGRTVRVSFRKLFFGT